MEQIFLTMWIILEGIAPLAAIWFFVYLIAIALKGDPQTIKKFNRAYLVVLFWSIGIVLFFTIYEVSVNMLINKGLLVKNSSADYSMPIFYIVLLMSIIMLTAEIKFLEIFKWMPASRHNKKINLKDMTRYVVIGSLFGLSYSTIILAMGIYFILEIGMSALAMHPIYGDNILFFFGVVLLIAEIIVGILTGLKEGIKYGSQSS